MNRNPVTLSTGIRVGCRFLVGVVFVILAVLTLGCLTRTEAASVYLTDVPDYEWYYGCFGTATGNLMGYWDRHGMENFYTGPTAGGVAPIDSNGSRGHSGIISLWASKAGQDGRLASQPGHVDDYWVTYEGTARDPYAAAGRQEHTPDCIGDFIGLNQMKWKNMNGECDGNIDGFSFVYWDATGGRRINYTPTAVAGLPATDIPSGLRAWTAWRGYAADVFTQLADLNPLVRSGGGFKFEDLQTEINAGYPVLLFLQNPAANSRALGGIDRANPRIHGMLAYGYLVNSEGERFVRMRTSWGSGDSIFNPWVSGDWLPANSLHLPLRGVIGFHPQPRIMSVARSGGQLTVRWHGPSSMRYDEEAGTFTPAHWYVLESATTLGPNHFAPVGEPTADREVTLQPGTDRTLFLRVRLLPPPAP